MKSKFFWIVIVIVLIAGVGVLTKDKWSASDKDSVAATQATIKIGGIVPLTGNAAAYGLPLQKSATLAMNEINLAGGINGQQLEIVWQDGKCEARDATTATQKLVAVDGVKIILGGVCSSETLAMAPITEGAKVILLSPASTSPDITTAGDFVFRTAPSDALAGRVAAEYAMKTLGAKRLAVIAETKDYTQGLRRVFKESVEAAGGTIVADEVFGSTDTNMRTQLTKVKAANPDLLYVLPQTGAQGTLLMKQMKDLGLETKLMTAEVMLDRNFVKEQGKLLEGMIGIEQYFNESSDRAQAFLKAYKETYEEDATLPAYMADMYSQVYLVKDAIEAKGLNTEAIRDYFYSLNGWEGALGSLTFDKNGDVLSQYAIKQVKNGALTDLELYTPGQ